MDTFKLLKRRTTDLLQSIPALPTIGNSKPVLKGTWEKISVPPLPRSSHSVNIIGGNVYIFGGEIDPRKPVDNDMHVVTLPSSGAQADYYAIKAKAADRPAPAPAPAPEPVPEPVPAAEDAEKDLDEIPLASPKIGTPPDEKVTIDKGKGVAVDLGLDVVPAPRVGHATAAIGHRIFLFGGRGGPAMEALEEGGRVWVFDTRTNLWSYIDPVSPGSLPAVVPPPRSYHSAIASDKPDDFNQASHHSKPSTRTESWKEWARGDSDEVGTPQRPIVGNVATRAVDADADGYGTFIIHGGCLASGRASDVWAFDVHSRVWQRLPDAPGKPRGGTSLAISKSRLYRFGGFNGEGEEGGQLDYLHLGVDRFDDEFSAGEVTLSVRGGWESLLQGKENVGYKEEDEADSPALLLSGEEWPGHRSVASLEAVTIGGGREYLVLMLGERDPSNDGHAAAGKFWDDVWAFQVPSLGMTPASLTDTVLSAVGRKTGEGKWIRVETSPYDDEDDASVEGPGGRGWIASGTMSDLEDNGIVVWGGLNAENQRLGDGWIFRLG